MPVSIINTFKSFTINYEKTLGEDFVYWMHFIIYLGNGLFRIFWGYMYDKLGFKRLMIFDLSLVIIVASTFYFIIEIKALLVVYIIVISSLAAFPNSLMPSGVQQVFGVKYSSEIYGATFYCFGTASLVVPILSKSLNLSSSVSTIPYLVIYLSCGGLAVIGLITIIIMNMKPYVYKYY